jgi:hypothetical protein
MDTLLLPKDPISPTDKVPYICDNRYDFMEFMTYPQRVGRTGIMPPPQELGNFPGDFFNTKYPGTLDEQERLFQSWLFFGLLSEFIGGNVYEYSKSPALDRAGMVSSIPRRQSAEFLYDDFVYELEGKQYLTTMKLIPLLAETLSNPPGPRDDLDYHRRRYRHIALCLKYTSKMLITCGPQFSRNIRYSIAFLGETLTYIMNAVFRVSNMEIVIGSTYAKGYYNPEIRAAMILQQGWCPSDVARAEANYNSLHTLHMLSKMDRSGSGRSHDGCTMQQCVSDRLA